MPSSSTLTRTPLFSRPVRSVGLAIIAADTRLPVDDKPVTGVQGTDSMCKRLLLRFRKDPAMLLGVALRTASLVMQALLLLCDLATGFYSGVTNALREFVFFPTAFRKNSAMHPRPVEVQRVQSWSARYSVDR
ncbi:hypothetical protein X751_30540 [Mesorhizobium sp. LNJC395A00]|nr:hypothetical protein X751_30540 [Mesorhizobium sp. LNJC395A00]